MYPFYCLQYSIEFNWKYDIWVEASTVNATVMYRISMTVVNKSGCNPIFRKLVYLGQNRFIHIFKQQNGIKTFASTLRSCI